MHAVAPLAAQCSHFFVLALGVLVEANVLHFQLDYLLLFESDFIVDFAQLNFSNFSTWDHFGADVFEVHSENLLNIFLCLFEKN